MKADKIPDDPPFNLFFSFLMWAGLIGGVIALIIFLATHS